MANRGGRGADWKADCWVNHTQRGSNPLPSAVTVPKPGLRGQIVTLLCVGSNPIGHPKGKKMKTKQVIVAGLLGLSSVIAAISCSGTQEICLCEVVWYDAFCQHDPNSLGGLDIEQSVIDVPCPSSYPADAGVGVSVGDPGFAEMEKSAKNKIVTWTGLTEGQVNPDVKRRSFIDVLGCKKFILKYGEGNPKSWWRFNPGKFTKDVDPCADGIVIDKDTETVTYPAGCNLVEKDFVNYFGPLLCEAAQKSICDQNSSDGNCLACAKQHCCDYYAACVNDPGCQNVLSCVASGGDPASCGIQSNINATLLDNCFEPNCVNTTDSCISMSSMCGTLSAGASCTNMSDCASCICSYSADGYICL